MSTSGVEHKFLELGHFSFGHGRPPCPILDALLCSDFSPLHSGDHRKVVPTADPRLVHVPGHRAQVLWAHDTVKLRLTTLLIPMAATCGTHGCPHCSSRCWSQYNWNLSIIGTTSISSRTLPSHAGPCIPYHSILSESRCSSSAKHSFNSMFKSPPMKKSKAPSLFSLHESGSHRLQGLDVVHLIASTVRHVNWKQHRRAHQDGGASFNVNAWTTKVINLPWAQHGCSTVVSTINNISRDVRRRSRPVISLLYCTETEKVVQNVVFMSQVVQPHTTPATLFSVEIKGTKEPRRNASNKRVWTTSGSTCYDERGQRDREGRSPRRGRHR